MTYSSSSLRFRARLSRNVICAAVAVLYAVSLAAQAPSFGTFDAPDAGTQRDQGTFPTSINEHGMGTGWYVDSAGAAHGFFRTNDGSITEFDAPGLTGTMPAAINLSN